jgi:chromosome segregation ATPase
MKVLKENIEKMEAQLLRWDAKLDELIAKADAVRAEAKSDHRKHIDELKAKQRHAKAKIEEFKASGSEKWEILKTGVETAWNDLEDAFKKLKD